MNIITFIEDCLIYFAVFLSSAYVYIKALQIKFNIKKFAYLSGCSVVLSILPVIIKNGNAIYPRFVFIALTCVALMLLEKNTFYITLPAALISMGLSYGFQLIITVAVTNILFLFGIVEPDTVSIISILVIQVIAVILFMHIKRFRRGFAFLRDKNNLGIGLLISGIVFALTTIVGQLNNDDRTVIIIILISIFICTVGLIIWIDAAITQSYIKRLQKRELDKFNDDLKQRDMYIEKLESSNTFLSSVVHRDNHLMSSLNCCINDYLANDDEDQKAKILEGILKLTDERAEIIQKEQAQNKVLPKTEIAVIDGALTNMYIMATAHNISFELVITDDIHYLVNNIITQTELETLLCDHIKNAVIAIDSAKIGSGKLMVTIGKTNGDYIISIYDNGIPFDKDVLMQLGLKRVTTHNDKGGKGIGFMTTFDAMKKSGLSLIINEFENARFTKRIDFIFDSKQQFIIKSYRSEQLKTVTERSDVVIE